MRFECQVRGTRMPIVYSFDEHSLSELARRVNSHLRDGLITHAEAHDVLDWGDEMVAGLNGFKRLLDVLKW